MALLKLENIAVLAISKEVVQGIGHGSPQVIIRLVFAQIISKITGSEVTPFAVITYESTGVKYPLADYELLPKMAIVDADMMMNAPRARYPRRPPRFGSLCLHHGNGLHRWPGPAQPEADLRESARSL